MADGGQLVGAGIAYVYNQFHLTLPFTSFHFYSHYLEITYLTFTINFPFPVIHSRPQFYCCGLNLQ